MTNGKETALIYSFAVGVPALIEFHSYSSYLSSPWTTGKLPKDGEDIEHFWRLFWEATASSLIFTAIVGGTLAWGYGSAWPLVVALASATAVTVWMYLDYKDAIEG